MIEAPKNVTLELISNERIIEKIQKIILTKNEAYWGEKFKNEKDVCCTPINDISNFLNDKHIIEKKIFNYTIELDKKFIPVIPTSLERNMIKLKKINKVPKLGQHNKLIK